jgi:hypothetical protein
VVKKEDGGRNQCQVRYNGGQSTDRQCEEEKGSEFPLFDTALLTGISVNRVGTTEDYVQ